MATACAAIPPAGRLFALDPATGGGVEYARRNLHCRGSGGAQPPEVAAYGDTGRRLSASMDGHTAFEVNRQDHLGFDACAIHRRERSGEGGSFATSRLWWMACCT
jgi:hypothetical protein